MMQATVPDNGQPTPMIIPRSVLEHLALERVIAVAILDFDNP